MQALLSFEQAPPISAPLRFFLTAPLFSMLAGALFLYGGPELLTSRWTPAALALTHLITVGFMLQVMLGALQQLLPVVVGANVPRPLRTATLVHAAITPGALLLAAAFLSYVPLLFEAAVAFLLTGVAIFIWAAGRALYGMAASNPTVRGLRLALGGLGLSVASGVLLALSLALSANLPLLQLADLHLAWGFAAWGCAVLATVGFVVVPMFQLTPEYPDWFGRHFGLAMLGAVSLWTLADLAGWTVPAALAGAAVVAAGAVFCVVTLRLLGRSKRPKPDASHHFWRFAMWAACLACALWLATRLSETLAAWQGWPLLFGALLLFGCFMSVITGMLYKIVPFLVWLHLQNRGRGKVLAPNMKKVLPQKSIDRQMLAHFVSCALLLLAVCWPVWFVYPAGLALMLSNAWLLRNLLHAVAVYRGHLVTIAGAATAVK